MSYSLPAIVFAIYGLITAIYTGNWGPRPWEDILPPFIGIYLSFIYAILVEIKDRLPGDK